MNTLTFYTKGKNQWDKIAYSLIAKLQCICIFTSGLFLRTPTFTVLLTLLAFVGICLVINWRIASIGSQNVVVLVNRVLSKGSVNWP